MLSTNTLRNTCRLPLWAGVLLLGGCLQDVPLISSPGAKTHSLHLAHNPLAAFKPLEVKSFDVYQSEQQLDVLLAAATPPSKQLQAYYLHSADGGEHWSEPLALGNQLPAPLATRGNDVQIARHGAQLLAVWQTQGELPNMGPLVSVLSTDNGKTWQQQSNPAQNNAGDQSHADLLADQNGQWHSVWLEDPEENGYQSLRYARADTTGLSWSKAQTLDDSSCSCCWNTLALGTSGELNVLYRDMQPRDMRLLQSPDQGVTWQQQALVGDFGWQFDGCPHIGGGLAIAADKRLHSVVWSGKEQRQGLYYLSSSDNGHSWSSPFPLGAMAAHGDIVAYGTQQLALVWDERGPEGSKIMARQSSDAAKTWHDAVQISAPKANASHPRIVHTSAGTLGLWTEKQPGTPSQWVVAWLD